METALTVPRMAELAAPPSWRTVDFISDVHLHAGDEATFAAWQAYLQSTPADAVFILGDLFEVWVGDDAVGADFRAQPQASFENRCASVLAQAASRLALFFMHGNRDFLVGPAFMDACRATLLDDPTVLVFAGQRWLLSHGDALCLDDTGYMRVRQQVRGKDWQQAFLARPLAERQAMAREMRRQSQAHQQDMDHGGVDDAAARQWLQAADARTLIHGHTHKPAGHDLGEGLSRVVLSDWDAQDSAPRADVLRLSASGLQRIALLSP
ncbi:UDP-2,3-diacylglucosamine diphosphatase [Polaromonas naphthalenivorans]|uniref:UDP-2,3-diacylglucosamine hydrolase n=1 Tax=Polaromonas naphthalenivorans (strain CJ2) TaxID=365044 RepID=A1VRB8_POLNA|nr:UDP-2,3-diacylglucosamine diphosphatase [Polaromonas naphthalenivorans]ABM38196.1 UDP-2,3-diacylglucosamine hydrolase [Polaromonas naphthalenivorans CJ2]